MASRSNISKRERGSRKPSSRKFIPALEASTQKSFFCIWLKMLRTKFSRFRLMAGRNLCPNLSMPAQNFVNPPATPKYNGGVERGNRIFREEFYANPNLLADSLNAMRSSLQEAVKKYNNYRPHQSLNGLHSSLLYSTLFGGYFDSFLMNLYNSSLNSGQSTQNLLKLIPTSTIYSFEAAS